jgi:ribosomal protein S2
MRLSTDYLSQNFFNVGKAESLRNAANSDWITKTPSQHNHIHNSFAILSIRKNLVMSAKTISKGGKPLVFHKHGAEVAAHSIRRFFTKLWPNGLISNYKRISKKSKRLPNLIVLVVNENTKRIAIETEVLRAKVNSFFVTSTNNSCLGLYNIFGNNDSAKSSNFLNSLLIRSISLGLMQETAKIRIKKRKFPRLGSNQRPRT